MILENLTNRGATPALVSTLTFTEGRQRMLAENVANWQTPGFKAKQLDYGAFQKSLRSALNRKGGNPNADFDLGSNEQYGSDGPWRTRVTPTTQPSRNILLHDRTNLSIEQTMSDLASNALLHQTATTLLKGYYDGMRKAIRGQV